MSEGIKIVPFGFRLTADMRVLEDKCKIKSRAIRISSQKGRHPSVEYFLYLTKFDRGMSITLIKTKNHVKTE
jgi:hypothetical protein